jgi:hypothetical protein
VPSGHWLFEGPVFVFTGEAEDREFRMMKRSPFKALQAIAALEFLKAPGFSRSEDVARDFDTGAIGEKDKNDGRLVLVLPPPKKLGRRTSRGL